jgi:DUF1009 family protein
MLFRRSAAGWKTKSKMSRREDSTGSSVSGSRIGIVAGGGRLPVLVAESVSANGAKPLIIMLDGEVEDAAAYKDFETERLQLEQASQLLPILNKHGVDRVVLAGSVARRPRLRDLKWDRRMISWLPPVAKALWQGDNVLLSALIGILERHGIEVIGAHEVAASLLASEGVLTKAKPSKSDERDINAARTAALAIGELDIGQAAVSIGGRAIALEGIEGTEGLLERVAALRSHGRLAGKERGVLAKVSKPQQEVRADLPAIGPKTIEMAHQAKLAGVAVEAGRSLILDGPDVIRLANKYGLFVIGLKPGQGA